MAALRCPLCGHPMDIDTFMGVFDDLWLSDEQDALEAYCLNEACPYSETRIIEETEHGPVFGDIHASIE